jgi:predicted kinase
MESVMGPWCLVITGPPCSGKSYLARQVAAAFQVPYLSKDGLKEVLFDSLGWDDALLADRLNAASYELLYHVLGVLMPGGNALLVESNFRPEVASARLRRLAAEHGYQTLQVYCSAPPEVLVERFRQRWTGGERHPGHGDDAQGERIAQSIAQQRYGVLDLVGPVIRVDATDLLQVDVQVVLAQIASLTGWH